MEMESGVCPGTTGYKSSILSGFEPAISLYLCATLMMGILKYLTQITSPETNAANVLFIFILC